MKRGYWSGMSNGLRVWFVIAVLYFIVAGATFLQSPIIGTGIGGVGTALRSGYSEFFVHNRYLEIMSELGIVGLLLIVLFTVLLYSRFKSALSIVNTKPALLGLSIAGAALIQRYSLSMSGGDLLGWRIGIWAGLAIAIFAQSLVDVESNESLIHPISDEDTPRIEPSQFITGQM